MGSMSPHLDPDWLRTKYIDEEMSTYDIAKIVGRDPKRIYQKLIDFGIPTRPRGLNLKGNDHWSRIPGMDPSFLGKKHSESTKQKIREASCRPNPKLRGEGNGMFGRTGEQNPNYKGGSSPERQRLYSSGVFKSVIRRVYARDSYRCRRCGSFGNGPRGIHAHHVKSWAEHPGSRFDVDNLITLCRPCHAWVHSRSNDLREYLA